MRQDKHLALRLRKQGKSYNIISNSLNIPKSTLSEWLHSRQWSENTKQTLNNIAKRKSSIRIRKLNKIRKKNLAYIYEEAKQEALIEMNTFKFHPLFITGVVMYWEAGDRISKGMVRVSNVDPLMIKLFIHFLIDICGIEKKKIKSWLLLYSDLQDRKCRDFWKKNTGLKEINFNKSITIKGKHKTRRVHYGICNIGITSSYLKEKMLVWLKLLPNCILEMRNKKWE